MDKKLKFLFSVFGVSLIMSGFYVSFFGSRIFASVRGLIIFLFFYLKDGQINPASAITIEFTNLMKALFPFVSGLFFAVIGLLLLKRAETESKLFGFLKKLTSLEIALLYVTVTLIFFGLQVGYLEWRFFVGNFFLGLPVWIFQCLTGAMEWFQIFEEFKTLAHLIFDFVFMVLLVLFGIFVSKNILSRASARVGRRVNG